MKKSFPVLHLPPDNSNGCPTAVVPWETENNQPFLTHDSTLFTTAKRLHAHPRNPFPLLLLSMIAPALVAGTGSRGDTEHIVCCRGLRTLVANSKHIIMQNYRVIELGETWKDHMDDSGTGHICVTPDRHLLRILNLNHRLKPITSYTAHTKKSSSLPLSSSHLHVCKMLLNNLNNLFLTK